MGAVKNHFHDEICNRADDANEGTISDEQCTNPVWHEIFGKGLRPCPTNPATITQIGKVDIANVD